MFSVSTRKRQDRSVLKISYGLEILRQERVVYYGVVNTPIERGVPKYVQFLPCVVRHRDWVQVDGGYEGHSYVVLPG